MQMVLCFVIIFEASAEANLKSQMLQEVRRYLPTLIRVRRRRKSGNEKTFFPCSDPQCTCLVLSANRSQGTNPEILL